MYYLPEMLARRLVAAEVVAVPFAVGSATRWLRLRLGGLLSGRLGSDSSRDRDLRRLRTLSSSKGEISDLY
jgi:hypothetical protein